MNIGHNVIARNVLTRLGEEHMERARSVMTDEDYAKYYGDKDAADIGYELCRNGCVNIEVVGEPTLNLKGVEALRKEGLFKETSSLIEGDYILLPNE